MSRSAFGHRLPRCSVPKPIQYNLSVLTCLYNYNLTSCKRSVARRIRVLITHQTVAMIHMHMYNSKMKLVEKIKEKEENNCTRKLSNLCNIISIYLIAFEYVLIAKESF